EEGILGNFSFEAAKHFFITGGFDISRFPWLRYRCSAPSFGIKKELLARYSPSDKLTLEGLYSYRYSMLDDQGTGGIVEQTAVITRSIKGTVRYSLTDRLKLVTRIDHKKVSPVSSAGVLMLQDVNFRLSKIPLTVWLRYCIFRTGSYDSRIYTYENDLLYSFSIPALSGSGSRSYIMVKWETGKKAEIRFRYGITSIRAENGLPGNKEDFKIQVRLKF
ncbi:MAG TPA: hypothetical protein VJ963_11035, partial [Bacteroidales bacterium]|nr:hypothetical protein [Bacteroidales bacterium]